MIRRALSALLLLVPAAGAAQSQPVSSSYPLQPVKRIVPWPPGGGTPEEFARFMAAETARYAGIVKASGAKVE